MTRLKLMLLLSAVLCSVMAVRPQPTNPPPESVPRRQDFVHVTLDLNTAHRRLLLSENNRKATLVQEEQPYSDHPDRYEKSYQVLGSAGLTGRSYFEVQWNHWVDIAMTYKPTRNDGRVRGLRPLEDHGQYPNKEEFGDNSYSWSLRIYDGHFYVCAENVQKPIRPVSTGFAWGVVGVYLDYEAGILSFYEILDEGRASHLHTFREVFTQPLFPGFGVWIVFAKRGAGNSVLLVTPQLSPREDTSRSEDEEARGTE